MYTIRGLQSRQIGNRLKPKGFAVAQTNTLPLQQRSIPKHFHLSLSQQLTNSPRFIYKSRFLHTKSPNHFTICQQQQISTQQQQQQSSVESPPKTVNSVPNPSEMPSSTLTSQSIQSSQFSALTRFWHKWTAARAFPPRHSAAWYFELLLICTVFGITGSASMFLVRPLLKDVFGIEGSFKEGPNSYRLLCFAVCMPAYSLILLTVGTLAGRHHYFKNQVLKMWSRFDLRRYINRKQKLKQ